MCFEERCSAVPKKFITRPAKSRSLFYPISNQYSHQIEASQLICKIKNNNLKKMWRIQ